MKKILVFGAGKASTAAIKHLLFLSEGKEWFIVVADFVLEHALNTIQQHPCGKAIQINVETDVDLRKAEIKDSDIVISLLLPCLHSIIAQDCIEFGKNMVTASYAFNETKDIKDLNQKAKEKGIIILGEVGLDPGMDHMSALRIIEELQQKGAELTSFESYTGGILTPNATDNPWNYAFTWNPENVVLAGQGTAQYKKDGILNYVPYNRIFRHTKELSIVNIGEFEVYPNRDSYRYQKMYDLESIPTFIRGTLRSKGYPEAWDVFVKLGWTDNNCCVYNPEIYTYPKLIQAFLPIKYRKQKTTLKSQLAQFLGINENSDIIKKLEYLGLFKDEIIVLPKWYRASDQISIAKILQALLEIKWDLNAGGKDLVVMQHKIVYTLNDKNYKLVSNMIVQGDDSVMTAMAKTVGYPLAIAVALILEKSILLTGVHRPLMPEIYNPILNELEKVGIKFIEHIEQTNL